jgi:hypothetical protein
MELSHMANQIPVEIRRITDPDGTSRLGAIAFLEGVLSTPDIKDRLSTFEKEYFLLLKQCEDILSQTKTSKGRPNATLRWMLAEKINTFLVSNANKLGVILVNYVDALTRDLGISKSELRYIFRFYSKYKNANELDDRINWSKYRELMDFPDQKSRKQCEMLIKAGKIKSDTEIREFKRKLKAGKIS